MNTPRPVGDPESKINNSLTDLAQEARNFEAFAKVLDRSSEGMRKSVAKMAMELRVISSAVKALAAQDPPSTGGGDPPIVDPPIVDPPAHGNVSWTRAMRGCTADEAKTYIPPGYAEAREGMVPARARLHGRNEFEMGSNIVVKDKLLTGTEFKYERSMMSVFRTDPPGEPSTLVIDNVGLDIEDSSDNNYENFLRVFRVYNLSSLSCTASEFVGAMFGNLFTDGKDIRDRFKPMEHAVYGNVAGDSEFHACLFKNLGGRGPYIAHRDAPYQQYSADNVPYSSKPTHTMTSCRLIDTELDAVRGGYMDTIFDGGSTKFPGTVIRRNNVIVAAWPFVREQGNNKRYPVGSNVPYRGVRGEAAFVHHAYQQNDGQCLDLYHRSDELIHMTQGNRSLGGIRFAKKVIIERSCYEAIDHRDPFVDIGHEEHENSCSDLVILRDNVSATGVQFRVYHPDGTFVLFPVDAPGVEVTYNVVTRETIRRDI